MRFSSRPRGALGRAAALAVAVLAVLGPTARALAAPAATTFVTMISDGEYIGAGLAQMFHPGNGSVSLSGGPGSVVVAVSGGTHSKSFTLTLAAPSGQSLAVGTYEDAERAAFRSAGRPGIDVSGDGRGCNTIAGRFTVHDIGIDGSTVTRLWATYQQNCERGPRALIGEIRLAVPGGDSDVLVAGGIVEWPEVYPGTNGITVPVWFVNTGAVPFSVSATALSGAHPGDFSVLSNGCTAPIAVGSVCTVFVRFSPTAAGIRTATVTYTDSSPAGSHATSLAGTGISGHTAFVMRSDVGDYIGGGQNYNYTPSNATITASGSTNRVTVGVSAGPAWWSAAFKAASGDVLAPGTYTGATREPFSGSNVGLEVSGSGRGCNTLTGSFTIIEAVFKDGTGALQRFAATFEQHCEGATPALRGWVSWRATAPNLPDDIVPSAVTQLEAFTQINAAFVTWTNPADDDFSHVIVRAEESLTPPATPTSGVELYTGPEQGAPLDYLTPGAPYSVSVWAVDTSGNRSARVSLTLRGTDLDVFTSAAAINYGGTVTVTGALSDGTSGAPVVGELIDVYSRRRGTRAYVYEDTLTTSSYGRVSVTLQPLYSTDVRMVYHGEAPYIGTPGGVVTIAVRQRVSATLSASTVRRGTTVALRGSVAPNHAGQAVYLQQYVSGAWRTIATRALSSTSTYSFSVRPSAAGRYLYRVSKPGHTDHAAGLSTTRVLTAT